MTPLETGLVTGLFITLLGGAGVYVKLGRTVMTREEHDKDCARITAPLRADIENIQKTCDKLGDKFEETAARLNKKQDESTKDLTKEVQKILHFLLKMNGGGG